jgi:hypothetical protein
LRPWDCQARCIILIFNILIKSICSVMSEKKVPGFNPSPGSFKKCYKISPRNEAIARRLTGARHFWRRHRQPPHIGHNAIKPSVLVIFEPSFLMLSTRVAFFGFYDTLSDLWEHFGARLCPPGDALHFIQKLQTKIFLLLVEDKKIIYIIQMFLRGMNQKFINLYSTALTFLPVHRYGYKR